MAKVEIEIDDNSLDTNGDDGGIIGIVDDAAFGSTNRKHTLQGNNITREALVEDDLSYNLKEISGNVTYRFVQLCQDDEIPETPTSLLNNQDNNTYSQVYVIDNPNELLGSQPKKTESQIKPNFGKKPEKSSSKMKCMRVQRDDKRRATHNEVERRRRDKINAWIGKLAALVPNIDPSHSKGGILAKACDHIVDLTEKQTRLQQCVRENDKLMLEMLKVNQELTSLKKENTYLRNQLTSHGITININDRSSKS